MAGNEKSNYVENFHFFNQNFPVPNRMLKLLISSQYDGNI